MLTLIILLTRTHIQQYLIKFNLILNDYYSLIIRKIKKTLVKKIWKKKIYESRFICSFFHVSPNAFAKCSFTDNSTAFVGAVGEETFETVGAAVTTLCSSFIDKYLLPNDLRKCSSITESQTDGESVHSNKLRSTLIKYYQ